MILTWGRGQAAADQAAAMAQMAPAIPRSEVRHEIARDVQKYLDTKPTPMEAAKRAAKAAYVPRSPDVPLPSMLLTPRDRLEALHRFQVSSQHSYVDRITTAEKDQLLGVEREARELSKAAQAMQEDPTTAMGAPDYGVHPGSPNTELQVPATHPVESYILTAH